MIAPAGLTRPARGPTFPVDGREDDTMDGNARCPRCGAPLERSQPDPLARCPWCGCLLATRSWPAERLAARPRLDARNARSRVARALARRGLEWVPGPPVLTWFPFAPSRDPRRPYEPLSTMPPLLAREWRPSGADLVAGPEMPVDDGTAARVPASHPAPAGEPVIEYPFWRVPLRQEGEDSAAWCDAVDGQVILPEELAAAGTAARREPLRRWTLFCVLAGCLGGFLLPVPWSLFAVGAAGGWLFWRTARW